MAPPQSTNKATGGQPSKSTGAAAGRRKLNSFNKFMQSEMARLKVENPDMPHRERFNVASDNWKTAKESQKQST